MEVHQKNRYMNTFKILSIDGGGIKGLYSASVLARFEEKIGKRISDHFDMICGTSTGGMIALGLSAGMTAEALVNLYFKHGSEIFPTSNNSFIRYFQYRWQFLKQLLLFGKHSNKPLTKILEKTFESKTLGDAENLLCIPSFNLIKGEPRVFKFPHKEGSFFMDKNIKMVDVALATSAAPTYLPIHEHNNILYTDGGVWANNPSLCGLLEALQYFVGENKEYDTYQILSISSIAQPSGWASTERKSKSFRSWNSKLFQISMDGQAYFTDFFLNNIINNINPKGMYYRVPSPKLSNEHMGAIDMDKTDEKALKTIKALGDHDGYTYATKAEILEFFKTTKTYNTKK
ncbi:MAG: patatin-like phospholipase family protein [Bacteroidetes bacterium]|nr:patatin-like phospholipase family protein [Bacteroidota bacterium]